MTPPAGHPTIAYGGHPEIRPVTLGVLADQGLAVWAWCNGCFKNGPVATSTLIARLGRAYSVPDVGARMRCSCGSREIETRPNWPDNLGVITRSTDAVACA